jgi:hypothetical protein
MLLARTGIFAIVLLFAGCADERIQSSWMSASPSIDGNLEEWMEIPRLILSDAEASVRAGNDSSFLYIAGHIANALLRAKVRQFGIIVWLDPEGGHRKDLEVHIPASRVAGGNLARGGFWENLTTEEKARVLARMRELSRGVLVVDKRSVDSQLFPPGDREGFAGAFADSLGLLAFEARIPLRIDTIFQKCRKLEPRKSLSIGIGLGQSGLEGQATADLDGRSPARGAGLPGPLPTRGNNPRQSSAMPKEGEIWLEVVLASPQ